MKNQTSITEFNILGFSSKTLENYLLSILLSLLYWNGVMMNVIIVTTVYVNHSLKSPMYLFLCNLSCSDICFFTTTIPNLLYMLLSGNNRMSLTRCLTQMFFYYLAASTEDFVLVTMAYDRYVAICHPLHYHNILNRKTCTLLMFATCGLGGLNSAILTAPVSDMVFCMSNTVRQFFCEAKALATIACSGVEAFYMVVYFECFFVAVLAFLCCLVSYIKIFGVILDIKSWAGRRKAFSTCSSHLTILTLYYGTAATAYLIPESKNSGLCEEVMTVLYAVVTPLLNPLIYSLRNQELMGAIHKLLRK
ncbi:olfactory receptor 1G1-like [Gastrophryne carolinensis]